MSESGVRVGVSALVIRDGRCLLVQRGSEPNAGYWALPGGKLHWGEGLAEGALRELREETGVEAEALGVADISEIREPGHHYVLITQACRWQRGEGVAADDARALAWVSPAELEALGEAVVPGVRALVERTLSPRVE
ncbi:NUDIX hydrolase [Halomonas salifodinae]|uniref:NUDIX hydrolase n=1 Tax=Halomonas salifodinae TaxID=438745 RepID=UPI0033ADEE5D